MKNLRDNINLIKEIIESAKKSSENVEIVAVSKSFPYEDVSGALKCGIKHIGESRIQEALPKFALLGTELQGVTKHFVGRLQSNKAKKAVENFDLIHSLDGPELAKDISRHAAALNKVQNCLIEVKVSGESSKTGIKPELLGEFYRHCLSMPNISVQGLMAIAPLCENAEDARPYFRQVYKLFEELKKTAGSAGGGFNVLSMGMSGDFKVAVEEGANMVRIGSSIFGKRNYGNK